MTKNTDTAKAPKASRIPQNFMQAATDFEKSKIETVVKQNSLLKKFAFAGLFMGVIGMGTGAVATLVRQEPIPYVIKVNALTGASEVARSIKDTDDRYDEVTSKYWLAQYIKTCESYDWFTISAAFDACKLMSEDHIADQYARKTQAPDSPLVLLKDKGRLAVNVVSITFFGDVAAIRFTQQKLSPNGENTDNSPLQHKIATAAFHFKSGRKTEQERLINPLGFKIASYRVDSEAAQ